MKKFKELRKRTPYLETENLYFTLWEDDSMFLGYTLFGNPTIGRYWTYCLFTNSEIEEIILKEKMRFKEYKMCLFPVFTKDEHVFLGVCGLSIFKGECQFSLIFLPEHCKMEYAIEAGQAMIDYAFDKRNVLSLLAARCEEDTFSEHVYTELGFKEIRNCFRSPNDMTYHAYLLMNMKKILVNHSLLSF